MSEKNSKILKKAINKYTSGKHAEAVVLYKKIIKSEPDHLDANYMLGTLEAELNHPDRALTYLLKAERIEPGSHRVKNNLGNVYRLMGNFESAVHCYEEAIRLNQNMPEAYNNLAIIFNRLGESDKAEACYQQAISLSPGFVEALANLGKYYLDNNRLEDAESCYTRILSGDAAHAIACDGMAECCMRQGDAGRATEYLNRYLLNSAEDRHGVRMKLAYLTGTALPEKHPAQLVHDTYEKKADSWDQDVLRAEMEFLGPAHINHAVSRYYADSHDLKILDAGCGTGLCGEFLRPHAGLLQGADLSPHMLKQADKKGLYDVLFEADIESVMNDNPEYYNLITASGVFIFFGNLETILTCAANALMPGGRIIFTTYKSPVSDVSVRSNIHFAHSENHISTATKLAGLKLEDILPVVHEYERGQPQAGYVVTGRK